MNRMEYKGISSTTPSLEAWGDIAKYEAFAALEPDSEAARSFIALEDWANGGAPLPFATGVQIFENFIAADTPGTGAWQIGGVTLSHQYLSIVAGTLILLREQGNRIVGDVLVVVPAPAPAAPRMRRHRVALAARPALDLSTLTVRELILVAAVELSATTPGIDMLALVVRAWTIAPERFGFTIDGTNYPHTNRVLAKLAGPDGLCGLGWLESTARSTYRVTIRGARTPARLGARGAA